MTCAPSFTCSRPIAVVVSKSFASIASRKRFEPFAFVRSPTSRTERSWAKGTKL